MLQEKLDSMYPPFVSIHGETVRELEAVVPAEGERYAGEGCARCRVVGCDRYGLLFHLKNLLTHAAPRGGQPSRVAASRVHAGALHYLLGYVPDPPPMPPEGQGERKKKVKPARRRPPPKPPKKAALSSLSAKGGGYAAVAAAAARPRRASYMRRYG